MNKTDRLRLAVFKIWFVTLATVLVVYAVKFSGLQARVPFEAVFQSFEIMIGLVVPQIGVMTAFYLNLDGQREKIESLSQPQITVITWLSLTYHVILNAVLIFGILLQKFDPVPDGKSLQRNTAAVMAIMGLFSVFLSPVAFLFASPMKEKQDRRKPPSAKKPKAQ